MVRSRSGREAVAGRSRSGQGAFESIVAIMK
jgi:hypothetical protein